MTKLRSPNTPQYFIQRALIYTREMFPILIYLPYVVSLYFCVNVVVQIINTPIFKASKNGVSEAIFQAGSQVVIDSTAIIGVVSAFFFMLLMRTFDDLKDFELDEKLFPHRATARKDVLKRDIQLISISSFIILLTVNLIWGQAIILVFALTITYAILTFKWFFAEKFHREHIFITMLDHQPIPYVINFYLLHTALATGNEYESFQWFHLYLLLIVSIPITAWEISRKIRSADMETEYETFSLVIGRKTATIIPLVLFMTVAVLHVHIGKTLHFSPVFFYLVLAVSLIVLFFYLRFLIKPKKEYNVLTNTALFATSFYFINLLINTMVHYQVV